ncbi:hypothetical protein LCGC14_2006420 [marine sediment metagenome]|uniref:Uncharacterized protein n=1 Tax=marine sediment metagenome TaxID=412755 RepID=A0A0F9FPB9_9ZZZZ
MLTRHRLLAVLSIALIAVAAMYGSRALAESLGLAGDEGQHYPLTSDPAQSSDPRAVVPRGNWSLADAQDFDGFPLFWVGEEYAGLPLTAIIRSDYVSYERPGIQVREDSVTFLYGSCVIEGGEGGCAAPFQVAVASTCQSPPGLAAAMVRSGEPFQLRGALAQEYTDGHIELSTQDVSVTVFGPDPESMRALAGALRPLNPLARLGPGDALQPPQPLQQLNCPPLSPAEALDSSSRIP